MAKPSIRIVFRFAQRCLLAACGAALVAGVALAQTARSFDIPQQDLASALEAFAKQADKEVLFDLEQTRGKHSLPVKGELDPAAALRALMGVNGLPIRRLNDRTFVVGSPMNKDAAAGSAADMRLVQVQSGNVAAQSAQGAGRKPGAPASDEAGNPGEVIVTATKRAERIQDVPLSITAITNDDIDRRGLVNAADYLRGIPGVNQVDSPFGQSIVIRGLETSPAFQNFSAGTTVATYFGETPTTNSSGLGGGTNIDLKLVDVERVEVLRGPQGTAFGSSSLGGVVRTIPVAPNLERFEAKVGAGYSTTSGTGGDNHNAQLIANLPVIKDKLALRAVAYRYEDSGFYRNRAGSDENFLARIVAPFGAQAYAVDKDEIGQYHVLGGRVAALFQPADALTLTVSYLTQKTETDGFPLQNSGAYTQTVLEVAPDVMVRGQRSGAFDTDIDLANATLEYDFGWANLLATYSYVDGGSVFSQPGTITGLAFAATASSLGPSNHREHVGELRLSTRFAGPWNFLAGLYAEDLDDTYSSRSVWQGSIASSPFGGLLEIGRTSQQRNLEQKAAFAEMSWNFLPRFTLTGGVRAYDFDRNQHRDSSGPLLGVSDTQRRVSASGTSLRGNLSYEVPDRALLFAGWAQGFRLGKPQAGLTPGACDLDGNGIVDGAGFTIESTRSIDSDEVGSYNLGAKFTLFDKRVAITADIYRVDWTGVPVRVAAPRPPVGCGLAYTGNAGDARSEGVELQANIFVTPTFRIDIGGSKLRARLTKDAPGLVPPAFAGDRLPGSPDTNANLSLQYDFSVAGHEASVRADSIYVGRFFGNLQALPVSQSGDYIKVDAAARVQLGRLNLDLYVRNLTDEDEFTFRDTSQFVPFFGYRLRPRTVGLQLGYEF